MADIFLCDVALAEVKVTGGQTHLFATADEISGEPVIEEGENLPLKIKGQLLANKTTPDMILGHDITIKDNRFSAELLADIQGGTVTNVTEKFSKYTAPAIGAIKQTKSFDLSVYVEVVGDDGATGEYLKYTYPNCRGGFISPNFKDNEYFAAEYTIKSRPAIGVAAYTVDLVGELPSGANVLMHPALRQQLEEEGKL
ncbi:MAG: hypothetical protein ACRCX8_13820 [Sarcina sp.]